MTSFLRKWTGLAPTRHARIDNPRVPPKTFIRPDPQSFHHAGPKTIDEYVSLADQGHEFTAISLVFYIELDKGSAAL